MYSLVVYLLLLASIASTNVQKMQKIETGVWGGQHISIDVGAESATIEYDCAHGTIEGPLVVDARGNFEWCGTHTRERGGPIREDKQPKPQPATYQGTIKGDVMTLTLKLSGEEMETFTLKKGKEGRLVKCK